MSHLSAHFYTRSSQSHKSSLKFGKSLLQLGRINHCEYIPAVLVQIKVTTAARKRQQQDKPLKKKQKTKERPQTALSSSPVSGMWRRRQEMGVTRGMQKASAQQQNWYLKQEAHSQSPLWLFWAWCCCCRSSAPDVTLICVVYSS